MIAVPMLRIVKGAHKEVGPLNQLQGLPSVFLAGHRLAQWSTEVPQDGGLEEKREDRGRLERKDLLTEIVEHETMMARESAGKCGDAATALECERCQLHPCRPALRSLLDDGDVTWGQCMAERGLHKQADFGRAKAQVGSAQFDQLTLSAESCQWEWRNAARRNDEREME